MAREVKGNDPRLATFRLWLRFCAVGLYAHAALWGSLQLVFSNNAGVYLLTVMILALLATYWAIFDSKLRGRTILPVLQMLYFLIGLNRSRISTVPLMRPSVFSWINCPTYEEHRDATL